MTGAESRVAVFFVELERVYATDGTADALIKRLASWMGNADQSVLLLVSARVATHRQAAPCDSWASLHKQM